MESVLAAALFILTVVMTCIALIVSDQINMLNSTIVTLTKKTYKQGKKTAGFQQYIIQLREMLAKSTLMNEELKKQIKPHKPIYASSSTFLEGRC